MSERHAASRVLLSSFLLDIITAYQTGCYVDMIMLASLAAPLKDMVDRRHPRFWWLAGAPAHEDPFASFDPAMRVWYAEYGHNRLTKFIASMPRVRDIVVVHAVHSGNLLMLAQVPVSVVQSVQVPLLDLAALKGHLDVLKYLHADVGHNGCTTWAVESATLQGNVDMVAYLLASRQEGFYMTAFESAAANGHLEIVKLFHPLKPVAWLLGALRIAASQNHFAIVSYVLDVVGPADEHFTRALDGAASYGHLDMVQFLHERNVGCSTDAMDWAAGSGHLDVVKWLHENRSEGCTYNAMDNAASRGYLEVVRWLHEHRQEGCTRSALLYAVEDELWAVVPMLAWHREVVDVEMALKVAVERGSAAPDVVAELKSIIKSKQ